jgi:lambda family phage minor tail protein L
MSMFTEGLVTLYRLDCTPLGGSWYYFGSATDFTHDIIWGGTLYTPLPMEATGFEYTTRGAIPQPQIKISNLYGAGNSLVDGNNGLVGAYLLRYVTLRRFLDDGATPDANAYITYDRFVVAQKTSHTAIDITFKLAAKIDQQGTQLPRRLITRDFCSHTYRRWTGSAFDYSKATCPYTASSSWDANNNVADYPHDACSRSIIGCQLRFPGGQPLPGRFFPGVGKIR